MIIELLASSAGTFDVETATRAYLDTLQGSAQAQSDAYFEGGYWLIVWGALVSILIDGLILRFRLSSAFRNLGERWFKRPFAVTWLTALLYTLVGSIIALPWTIYTGFYREKQYSLLDQTFGAWLGEQAIALGLALALAPLVIAAVYAVIRRAQRTWWLWGSGVIGIFLLIAMVLGPVFISPLFNTYTEMEQSPLRNKIEAVAAKYEIPAEHIYVFDQSKQHKRISANVSGLGPTIRISLNDNLLERTGEDEVLAVMGHEMGHYKLNHAWWSVGIILAILALGLFLTSRIAPRLVIRYGRRCGIRDITDPASIPILSICLTAYLFVMTPAFNTLIRVNESQADAFGLDAAREPDGFAKVSMRLSEYRKIEPGEIEELLFFDHPSGATRVRMAMDWKVKHVENPEMIVPERGYLETE